MSHEISSLSRKELYKQISRRELLIKVGDVTKVLFWSGAISGMYGGISSARENLKIVEEVAIRVAGPSQEEIDWANTIKSPSYERVLRSRTPTIQDQDRAENILKAAEHRSDVQERVLKDRGTFYNPFLGLASSAISFTIGFAGRFLSKTAEAEKAELEKEKWKRDKQDRILYNSMQVIYPKPQQKELN